MASPSDDWHAKLLEVAKRGKQGGDEDLKPKPRKPPVGGKWMPNEDAQLKQLVEATSAAFIPVSHEPPSLDPSYLAERAGASPSTALTLRRAPMADFEKIVAQGLKQYEREIKELREFVEDAK